MKNTAVCQPLTHSLNVTVLLTQQSNMQRRPEGCPSVPEELEIKTKNNSGSPGYTAMLLPNLQPSLACFLTLLLQIPAMWGRPQPHTMVYTGSLLARMLVRFLASSVAFSMVGKWGVTLLPPAMLITHFEVFKPLKSQSPLISLNWIQINFQTLAFFISW